MMQQSNNRKEDEEGWVKIEDKPSYPTPFDLVIIMDDQGIRQPAWWTGTCWDYGHKRVLGNIVLWNRKKVEFHDVR